MVKEETTEDKIWREMEEKVTIAHPERRGQPFGAHRRSDIGWRTCRTKR